MKFAANILLILLLNNICQAQVILRFQPQITSNASTLGDLLRVTNDEHHWANLSLQSQPISGEVISKDKIIDWMQQQLGTIEYQWQGKTQTQVRALIKTPADKLIKKAQTALVQQLERRYKHVEVKPLTTLKDSQYSLESYKVEMNIGNTVARRVRLWLTNDQQRIPVWFKVKAFAQVLVATHDLAADSPIPKEAFLLQERDIAGLNDLPAQTIPDKKILKTAIERDSILLSTQLKEAPQVTQGTALKVSIKEHGIMILMDAVALTDGYLGQTITVKNPLTNKTLTARVSGVQQAEVRS